MNNLLLRQVTVLDPGGPLHNTVTDLHIVDGRLARAGQKLPKGDAVVIAMDGLYASPGWVDLRAHFRDPGEEYKEDLASGLDAAAAGGFTAVAVLPGTKPVTDNRAGVEYLLRKSQGHIVRVLPLGALTKGMAGKEIAELFDMHQAGAVAFTDDLSPVRNARLMMLALQYAMNFDGRVMALPLDTDLAAMGQMHEGVMSTRLGMRGIPAMAEAVRLARDLQLLEYTGSRLHVSTLSTAEGVELVRKAKAEKLNVTASVAAHHLMLDDGVLRGFDTNYKVLPPLRSPEHIEALRDGVKDGTIDCVVSDHRPEDVEHKRIEFAQAAFGAIGLETAFAVANTALKSRMTVLRMVERFCQGPRAALGLPVPHLVEGETLEATFFAPGHQWMLTAADIASKSHNSPFIGHRFTGKAMGIAANGQVKWGGRP